MRPAKTAEREGAQGVRPQPTAAEFLDTFRVSEIDGEEASGELTNGPGLKGSLELIRAESLAPTDTVPVLKQLAALVSWAQAQQALVIHHMENHLRLDIEQGLGPVDESLVLTAAAAEVGSALNLPHMSAMALVAESGTLCTVNRSTHAQLSHGSISYRHAQRIMEEVQFVPERQAAEFEDELIQLAGGRTCAQFTAKARRLRESRWPETITVRHRQALELRRVSLDPKPDGMAELSALVAAEKGQAIFNALTAAARTARSAGDSRTLDQLRTDVFTAAVLNGQSLQSGPLATAVQQQWLRGDGAGSGSSSGSGSGPGPGSGSGPADSSVPHQEAPTSDDLPGIKAEIMVLMEAGTLFGSDNNPAELNGYGPISAEAARRLARQALQWTGLVKDGNSGEILAVGRRRKVPAGLRRWLQARDGTCRFPGCRVSTFRTEIDHTIPWGEGGATEHGNLENLCPKHHRLKTLGLWEARQPQPGTMEWVSPLGHRYRTEAQLDYATPVPEPSEARSQEASVPPDRPPF